MTGLETVEGNVSPVVDLNMDPILQKQQEDVARMRASLLSCSNSPSLAKNALQNIAVMQIYHQVSRVIRYLDLMDKLEDKLYTSIEYTIEKANPTSSSTWLMLSSIQEKLQKSMIESNKLMEPYLDLHNLRLFDLAEPEEDTTLTGNAALLGSDSRENVRRNAQKILLELQG